MTDDAVPARGSLRSRGAALVSALTLRQISAILPPEQAWGLWLSRLIVAGIMDAFGPSLASIRVEPIDAVQPDGRRLVGEWVRAPGITATDKAIYFVHGSGYALCSPRTHRRLTAWLSRLTGLPVFAVDYRLAPRHRFPTAADDVQAGWDWLTHQVPPDQVVIAGDSAGGHLAVDMLLQPDVAVSGPAALVLFSPLIDLTFGLARAREELRRDPAIRAVEAARLVALYCGSVDSAHRRLALDVAGGPVAAPDTHPSRRRRDTGRRCAPPRCRYPSRRRYVRASSVARPGALVPGTAPVVPGGRKSHGARRAFHRYVVASQRP
jgi:monoterpene epsilon-lactone hydrolase